MYDKAIFEGLPERIDALFLPVNGAGNNMNMTDAARFAARVGTGVVIPYHFGMFDEIVPKEFCCENKVIPTIYDSNRKLIAMYADRK